MIFPGIHPCALGITAEMLSDWRSKQAPEAERQRMSTHIPSCAACQAIVADYDRIAQALRQQTIPDVRPQIWREIQARRISGRHIMPHQRTVLIGSISTLIAVALLIVLFNQVLGNHPVKSVIPPPPETATPIPTATPFPTATLLPTAVSSPPPLTQQYKFYEQDSGRTVNFGVTSRFDIILDQGKYPQSDYVVTCTPTGTISNIMDPPSVNAPLYAVSYEGGMLGNCTITNKSFRLNVNIVSIP